jgi:pyruvate formate lyase activating enzyme
MSKMLCGICPQNCMLEDGQTGFCRARTRCGDEIHANNYGRVTSMALDPIEKKPLRRFHSGRMILSVGSYGCNLRCPFCQNFEISMADDKINNTYISPEALIEKAQQIKGNLGVAFTYNEPLIGYEYVRDCARLLKQNGLKTVLVTNGYINEEPMEKLLPLIDAMNIDLKAFTESYYESLKGHLEPVKRTIALCAPRCHVEVTTLIVPGQNDSEEEMRALSGWLAGIDKTIPLHISRFFPRYHMETLRRHPWTRFKGWRLSHARRSHTFTQAIADSL